MKKSWRTLLWVSTIGASTLVPVVAGQSAASAALIPCNRAYYIQDAFVPAIYPSFTPYKCQLRRGDTGEAVHQLQNTLDMCYGERLITDGEFGPLTEAALKRAQSRAGTTPDGIYGPLTRNAIQHQSGDGVHCHRVSL
jgi:murein L,D-transpeptidase YcbB/YkuD